MFSIILALVFISGFLVGYSATILDKEENPCQESVDSSIEDQDQTVEDDDEDQEILEDQDDEPIKRFFYVAGSYRGRETIPPYIDSLRANGYECTWDWPSCETHSQDHATMGHFAAKDIEGVQNANVVVAIMNDPGYAYRGTFTEIGCALGAGIPVVIYCPVNRDEMYARTNCFFCHPSITHVSTWEEAMAAVQDILD